MKRKRLTDIHTTMITGDVCVSAVLTLRWNSRRRVSGLYYVLIEGIVGDQRENRDLPIVEEMVENRRSRKTGKARVQINLRIFPDNFETDSRIEKCGR